MSQHNEYRLASNTTDSPTTRCDAARTRDDRNTVPIANIRGEDTVGLSNSARFAAVLLLNDDSSVRDDLVNRVREEISNGCYENHNKMDKAIDAFLEDLDIPTRSTKPETPFASTEGADSHTHNDDCPATDNTLSRLIRNLDMSTLSLINTNRNLSAAHNSLLMFLVTPFAGDLAWAE